MVPMGQLLLVWLVPLWRLQQAMQLRLQEQAQVPAELLVLYLALHPAQLHGLLAAGTPGTAGSASCRMSRSRHENIIRIQQQVYGLRQMSAC